MTENHGLSKVRGTKTNVLTVLLPLLQYMHTGNVVTPLSVSVLAVFKPRAFRVVFRIVLQHTAAEVIGVAVVRSSLCNYKIKTSDR